MDSTKNDTDTVVLRCYDNKEFVVPRKVARKSVLISNMMEDIPDGSGAIPIHNVRGLVMEKVLEYCTHYADTEVQEDEGDSDEEFDVPARTIDIKPWDAKFIDVDVEMLFELLQAANFLEIKPLLNLGCKTVASMLKGRTPEEIRKQFNIPNDFTEEEEEQIRKENQWAEDR
ncbi:hypothetical protein IWQ62_000409 [Dispira parvispora]|uniref:E3 ubiquitin ligase complex SCF subunit n=1 Tax=Dispira parvispora TaxID=1520584 RepID=A0A9W8E521_9FUNG|nr:hypothetical protein IWQ62_000409 [Dispira parvispora]